MRLKEVEGQIGTKGGRVKRRIKIERGQKEKKKKKKAVEVETREGRRDGQRRREI